jgi:hypothetical protein
MIVAILLSNLQFHTRLRAGRSEDRMLVGSRFFAVVQTCHETHTARSLSRAGRGGGGINWQRNCLNHPPLSNVEVKETIDYFSFSSGSDLVDCSRAKFTILQLYIPRVSWRWVSSSQFQEHISSKQCIRTHKSVFNPNLTTHLVLSSYPRVVEGGEKRDRALGCVVLI